MDGDEATGYSGGPVSRSAEKARQSHRNAHSWGSDWDAVLFVAPQMMIGFRFVIKTMLTMH